MAEKTYPTAKGHRHDPIPHKGGRGAHEDEAVRVEEARFGVKDKAGLPGPKPMC